MITPWETRQFIAKLQKPDGSTQKVAEKPEDTLYTDAWRLWDLLPSQLAQPSDTKRVLTKLAEKMKETGSVLKIDVHLTYTLTADDVLNRLTKQGSARKSNADLGAVDALFAAVETPQAEAVGETPPAPPAES